MYSATVADILESKSDISKVTPPIAVKKPNKSKAKGNKYENEIAKQLGVWIFNDKDVFQRSLTSGACKNVYVGDIVPQKQMLGWRRFPYIIECKNGYKGHVPTFFNHSIVEKWLIKCLIERTSEQPIILLIARFHNYSSILITDTVLLIDWKLSIRVNHNGLSYIFYLYSLSDIFERQFNEIFSKEIVEFIHTDK